MSQMPYVDFNQSCDRPDVFERRTLEQTFNILRKQYPSLALAVQNILASGCLTQELSPSDLSEQEHFFMGLDAHTVGKIVAGLTQIGNHSLDNMSDDEQLIIIKLLIQQWMALAEWIIHHAQKSLISSEAPS